MPNEESPPKGTSINIGGNVSGNIVVGNNNVVNNPTPPNEQESGRPPRSGPPLKIFLSYRRADSADVVGRIYDSLIQEFGRENVFKDVDSIPMGVDFRKFLADSVAQCNVFLAVIGRRWLVTEDGRRRLDDPADWVRIEIESALARNIPVVPITVSGASLPAASELPASLQDLVYRNSMAVRPDPDFHHDMRRLAESIQSAA
jgi:hypothetical protein